jgi:hypothetical protein
LRLDKEKIKESLTEKDIEIILRDLGSNCSKKDGQNNLLFQTVCHCGEKYKLYYYTDTKIFHCYTDCNESFDIYELVIRAKHQKGISFSFYDAVKYVSSITGKLFTSDSLFQRINNDLIDDWDWIARYKRKDKKQIVLPKFEENVLDVFIPLPHELWLSEGISYDTIMKFKISYYIREDRIAIPHFDINNNLVGIRGRALRQEDIEAGRKYLPLTIENKLYSHPTMYNLYGLHKTKNAITRIRKAIIFEDEKSVLKCEDYYGEDNFSVATGGSSLSDFQRDLLLSLGIEEVFLARDKEFTDPNSVEAYEYARKLLKQAYKFVPYCRTYILWDDFGLLNYKDSPADQGKQVLELLMKNKYEIKTTEGEV